MIIQKQTKQCCPKCFSYDCDWEMNMETLEIKCSKEGKEGELLK